MLTAFDAIAESRSDVRLLVVGGGDIERARSTMPRRLREQVTFLGRASDEEKAAALRTADLYVAPNTGGESFGIVLVEGMASGATVLASDIPAFRRVLDGGRLGVLFPSGNDSALASEAISLLGDHDRRARLTGEASLAVRRYDWPAVAGQIVQVYETIAAHPARGVS